MSILLGMGVGGLYMTTLRAGTIAIVGTLVFGVQFDAGSGGLAALVFLVTMAALYGLGMLLSSVFLMWGREAWQVAAGADRAGLLPDRDEFPAEQAVHHHPRRADVRFRAVPMSFGLDALRQLLFPGQIVGVLPAEVELAILAGMGVDLHRLGPISCSGGWNGWRKSKRG